MSRFRFGVLVLLAVLWPGAPRAAYGQTTVSVTPESLTVLTGSAFTLTFRVADVANLHLYHVVVHFDNTIIRCTSISSGGFLPGTFFFHSPQALPSDTARFVTVDDALIGSQTRSGSGVFFTIGFAALQPGTTPVTLVEVVLRDGSNQNIPHSVAAGSVTVTNPTAIVSLNIEANWNLLAVPVIPADLRRSALFPTAVSSAFRFANGYVATETLATGTGYWLKFPSAGAVSIGGFPLTEDTVAVRAGWNMIGGLTDPVDTAAVLPIPPLQILSDFFAFRPGFGYAAADTLAPGRGYWVKVNTDGGLILRPGTKLRR